MQLSNVVSWLSLYAAIGVNEISLCSPGHSAQVKLSLSDIWQHLPALRLLYAQKAEGATWEHRYYFVTHVIFAKSRWGRCLPNGASQMQHEFDFLKVCKISLRFTCRSGASPASSMFIHNGVHFVCLCRRRLLVSSQNQITSSFLGNSYSACECLECLTLMY
jgi:hypothetical protein